MTRHAIAGWALGLLMLGAGCEPETPRPPNPNEVCFDLQAPSGYESSCDETACFPKEKKVSENNPQAAGFKCDGSKPTCDLPDPEFLSGANSTIYAVSYGYPIDGLNVSLSFDNRILLGYSLEKLREYFLHAQLHWQPDPDHELFTEHALPPTQAEIVSYENGVIHVRVTTYGTTASSIIESPPYPCLDGLGRQTLCTREWCQYNAASSSKRVTLSADVKVPIQQPTP